MILPSSSSDTSTSRLLTLPRKKCAFWVSGWIAFTNWVHFLSVPSAMVRKSSAWLMGAHALQTVAVLMRLGVLPFRRASSSATSSRIPNMSSAARGGMVDWGACLIVDLCIRRECGALADDDGLPEKIHIRCAFQLGDL